MSLQSIYSTTHSNTQSIAVHQFSYTVLFVSSLFAWDWMCLLHFIIRNVTLIFTGGNVKTLHKTTSGKFSHNFLNHTCGFHLICSRLLLTNHLQIFDIFSGFNPLCTSVFWKKCWILTSRCQKLLAWKGLKGFIYCKLENIGHDRKFMLGVNILI